MFLLASTLIAVGNTLYTRDEFYGEDAVYAQERFMVFYWLSAFEKCVHKALSQSSQEFAYKEA